jgi:penicillin-insensitive murein DD-endopeptidase
MLGRPSGARGLALALSLCLTAAALPAGAQTVCLGRPSAGELRNGRQLQPRPYLSIKRGSEARTWGHGILLQLLSRGARSAATAVPGSIALVGDLSAPEGGPLSGHASHQAGRDADIAFLVSDSTGQPVTLDTFEAFGSDGRSLTNADHYFDAYRNWLMLREWLSELRVVVTHVFVSAELRLLLLEYGKQSPEFARYVPLAARVLHPHPTHTEHFHVRIACPTDQSAVCLDGSEAP